MILTPLQKQLLNDYQQGFPLSQTPYRDIADSLGVAEKEVLSALTELAENNYISLIGPVITPNRIGVSTLVAMAIPADSLSNVAQIISRYPQVNHNYEREHTFNLWFVIVAADNGQLQSLIEDIETRTGFDALQLPLFEDYYIDLGFGLDMENS